METKLRELLSPHFGHLDFLMKIHKDEISYDDMSLLVDMIKDKSLVSNLRKDLHSYSSYYFLMIELYFIKENLKYIKFFKELTKEPRDIFMNILKDNSRFKGIKEKIDKIIMDDELTSSFRRYSSRIKSEEYAITYVKLLNNSASFDKIFASTGSLMELKNYNNSIDYMPISWCITNRDTFYQYIRNQRIFLGVIDGLVYGVNVSHHNNQIVNIIDSSNNNVYNTTVSLQLSELLNSTLLSDNTSKIVELELPKTKKGFSILGRMKDILY